MKTPAAPPIPSNKLGGTPLRPGAPQVPSAPQRGVKLGPSWPQLGGMARLT